MQRIGVHLLKLRAVFASRLLKHIPHMVLHRVLRDKKLLRDHAVGFVPDQQPENFPLPVGKIMSLTEFLKDFLFPFLFPGLRLVDLPVNPEKEEDSRQEQDRGHADQHNFLTGEQQIHRRAKRIPGASQQQPGADKAGEKSF